MSWDMIIDQQRVKKVLQSSLQHQRLAHAYLFSGPEGAGKSAAAIEIAKIANCKYSAAAGACGKCSSCIKFHHLQHPNVNLIFALPVGKNEKYGDSPTAKLPDEEIALIQEEIRLKAKNLYHRIQIPGANTIKINSVREMRKESSMTMFGEGKRVFIVVDAEQLNDDAANALLKTLEEPHDNTLLILTTSQPERLLPTIISRCQHLRFDPLPEEEIAHALQSREGLRKDEAEGAARMANGSYRYALELRGTKIHERRSEAINFVRIALYKSHQELLAEIERITSAYEKHEIEEFLQFMESWFRDAMLITLGTRQLVLHSIDETVEKFSHHHPDIEYPAVFEITGRAISLVGKNVYIPLILINLALELRKLVIPATNKKHKPFQSAKEIPM